MRAIETKMHVDVYAGVRLGQKLPGMNVAGATDVCDNGQGGCLIP